MAKNDNIDYGTVTRVDSVQLYNVSSKIILARHGEREAHKSYGGVFWKRVHVHNFSLWLCKWN